MGSADTWEDHLYDSLNGTTLAAARQDVTADSHDTDDYGYITPRPPRYANNITIMREAGQLRRAPRDITPRPPIYANITILREAGKQQRAPRDITPRPPHYENDTVVREMWRQGEAPVSHEAGEPLYADIL